MRKQQILSLENNMEELNKINLQVQEHSLKIIELLTNEMNNLLDIINKKSGILKYGFDYRNLDELHKLLKENKIKEDVIHLNLFPETLIYSETILKIVRNYSKIYNKKIVVEILEDDYNYQRTNELNKIISNNKDITFILDDLDIINQNNFNLLLSLLKNNDNLIGFKIGYEDKEKLLKDEKELKDFFYKLKLINKPITIIIEGIETQEDLEHFDNIKEKTNNNINILYQGFYFHKPEIIK